MNMNGDVNGTEGTALESYDRCYCSELVEGETCVCCESSIIILDSGQRFAVDEKRREVQNQLWETPDTCQWFEYNLVSGEKTSLDRERIVAVKEWGENQ